MDHLYYFDCIGPAVVKQGSVPAALTCYDSDTIKTGIAEIVAVTAACYICLATDLEIVSNQREPSAPATAVSSPAYSAYNVKGGIHNGLAFCYFAPIIIIAQM